MAKLQKVWMLAFEAANIVKAGGLGEVSYNLSRSLAEKGLQVTLIMPSHGLHSSGKFLSKHELESLGYVEGHSWGLEFHRFSLHGFHVILVSGKGRAAVLNKLPPYSNAVEKSVFYAAGVTTLATLIGLPDVVHANDWHTVPAALKLKTVFPKVPLLLQIHLFIGQRVGVELFQDFLDLRPDDEVPVVSSKGVLRVPLGRLLAEKNFVMEKVGAEIASTVATVSKAFLKEDKGCLLERIGYEYEWKADYIPNGCDWDLGKILEEVGKRHKHLGSMRLNPLRSDDRAVMRKYLLEKALATLPPEEPFIPDPKVSEKLGQRIVGQPPHMKDGPLIITTGRASVQKGFDVLLEAFESVLDEVPEARLLMLLLPVAEELDYAVSLARKAEEFPRNVRIVFGIARSIFHLAHISADVFAAPSRWEPFGIMVLEAMSTGNAVAASRLGGMKETVVDIRENPRRGTGVLVEPENRRELAEALTALIWLMQGRLDKVSFEEVRSSGIGPEDVRRNAVRRVEENYRWSKVSEKAIDLYMTSISRLQG